MAIDMATDENIPFELEQEVTPDQNPSFFQPSVEPDPEINAAGRVV